VIARAEPGRARHLVERVHVLRGRPVLDGQQPIRLVHHRVADRQRRLEILQVVGLGARRHVGVVVLAPRHGAVREPPRAQGLAPRQAARGGNDGACAQRQARPPP